MPRIITRTIDTPKVTIIVLVAGSDGGGITIGVDVGFTFLVGTGD